MQELADDIVETYNSIAYNSMTAGQAAASSKSCSNRFSTIDGSVVMSPTPIGNSGFSVSCATLATLSDTNLNGQLCNSSFDLGSTRKATRSSNRLI